MQDQHMHVFMGEKGIIERNNLKQPSFGILCSLWEFYLISGLYYKLLIIRA